MPAAPKIQLNAFAPAPAAVRSGDPARLRIELESPDPIILELDCTLRWLDQAGRVVAERRLREDGLDISWLPRGRYRIDWSTPALNLAPGHYQIGVLLQHRWAGQLIDGATGQLELAVGGEQATAEPIRHDWQIDTVDPTAPIDQLSWQRGHEDWFFRHFDHAARTIISYLLADSPLLHGRVLDVGCGDGITDLGVFLRCQPERFVGVDPFQGYQRLPAVLAENHLPVEVLDDPRLSFLDADGNALPFADDSFDVVISWGSLEHIAGGHLKTLREIKRVLRDGGLLFAHPGLYYSNFGHHLGEFSSEPFFHLTKSEAELRELVFATQPQRIDRAGDIATPAQYWQWYQELNPITVDSFERELRELGFELFRAAVRTEDLIEYHHPALQQYTIHDLATVELYLSAWNRKPSPN